MKTLIILIIMTAMVNKATLLYDFNSLETSGNWYIVNDDVMGGISRSKMNLNSDGTATFSGQVSPENNGGFASVRTIIEKMDHSEFSGVILRVKGDGNKYSVRFRTNRNFDGYAYQAKFKTEKNEWQEYVIPFQDFVPTFRGYTLRDKPALKSSDIAQIGIMIADKQFGEFEVMVDWIKFYN